MDLVNSINALRRATRQRPGMRNPSSIESLPPEIIEQIFLYTCNPSLPRASLIIAEKLSYPYIYKIVFKRVFCQLINRVSENVWRTPDGLDESNQELGRLQNETLRCHWMQRGLFHDYYRDMLAREFVRRPIISSGMSSDTMEMWLGESVTIPPRLLRRAIDAPDGPQFYLLRRLSKLDVSLEDGCSEEEHLRVLYCAIESEDYRLMYVIWDLVAGLVTPSHLWEVVQRCNASTLARHLFRAMTLIWDSLPGPSDLEWMPYDGSFAVLEQKFPGVVTKDKRGNEIPDFVALWTARYPQDKEWRAEAKELESERQRWWLNVTTGV